ncbi:hypothetical protein B0H11DRAFT_2242322 [Mycena galericulata]|nr:hypothetical protein B0H11DRAFT_2242322 [Mycena galericulata]
MDRNILPEVGAFVVLTINPMASLDEATLGVEVIAARKKLVHKKYVALVGERHCLYQP